MGSSSIGVEEVRGLRFEPGAKHLVALVSGGTGAQMATAHTVMLRYVGHKCHLWAWPTRAKLANIGLTSDDVAPKWSTAVNIDETLANFGRLLCDRQNLD